MWIKQEVFESQTALPIVNMIGHVDLQPGRNQRDDIFDLLNGGQKVPFFDNLTHEILISKSTKKSCIFRRFLWIVGSCF